MEILGSRPLKNLLKGPVSRNSRKVFGPEKPLVKLRPAYSAKLVFSYIVKGIKIKITATFRASKRLRFEDRNRISRPEMRPKSFGTFEKQALKSCVTSNAESAIAGLPLTADNYKVAIDILKDRFGKPQLLISNYYGCLIETSICQFSA